MLKNNSTWVVKVNLAKQGIPDTTAMGLTRGDPAYPETPVERGWETQMGEKRVEDPLTIS